MSVPGQRRSVFVVVTLGALGLGCGAPTPPEFYPHQQASLNASAGWTVRGVVRGTSQHDELLDVVRVAPNRVMVAGYDDGRDGQAPIDPSGSSTDGTLIQYDFGSSGTSLAPSREKQVYLGRGNGANDVIEAITVESEVETFRVFFTGRTTGSYGQTANQGQFDTLVGWLDTSSGGSTLKAFQFGDNHPQHPRRLSVKGEQIVVAGYNDYTVSNGAVEAWEDPYLLKLSLTRQGSKPKSLAVSGSPWQAPVLETSYTDTALGMCVDSDDASSIYLAGNNSAGSKRGMSVRKYSASGQLVWDQRPSTIAMDTVAAIVKHPSQEGTIFAGSTYAALGTPVGDQDVVIRHLNRQGGTVWTYQDGSTGADWVTDMVVDPSGNIYVLGETLGSVDACFPSQGGYDLFVLKISADRTKREVFQMGSLGDDHPSSIALDVDDETKAVKKIYVAGYTTGDLGLPMDNPNANTIDPNTHGNFGGRDGFLLQLTPPTTPSTGCDVGAGW